MENAAESSNEGNEGEFRFGIRVGTPEDMDFIADSWRRSYDDSPWARCPGGLREYISTQSQVIQQCLKTSDVVVAHPVEPDNVPTQIMGWMCYRGTVVHYVYVKAPFRRQGIGTALVEGTLGNPTRIYHTHRLANVAQAKWVVGMCASFDYNPALIFGGTE